MASNPQKYTVYEDTSKPNSLTEKFYDVNDKDKPDNNNNNIDVSSQLLQPSLGAFENTSYSPVDGDTTTTTATAVPIGTHQEFDARYVETHRYGSFQEGIVVEGVPLYPYSQQLQSKFLIQGYKDVWAAVIFLICMFITFVIGVANFSLQFSSETRYGIHYDTLGVSGGTLVGALFITVVLCVIFAVISLVIFAKFPLQAIIASIIFSLILMLISSIVAFAEGNVGGGVVLLIVFLLTLLLFWFYRSRIPFSALLLKTATIITVTYKALVIVSFGIIGVFTLFIIFWAAMILPSVYHATQNTATAGDVFLMMFSLLIFFWASQVAFNVTHVTTSGVAATWYFVGGVNNMPANPTLKSLKRACTTSFGSICFGSMLVAILRLLRYIFRSQTEHTNSFIACCMSCLLNCLERLLEYFNHYAFVYCAMYGYGYIEAAKKSVSLIRNCAFAALFNDNLVGIVLTVTSLAVSFIISVIMAAGFTVAVGVVAFFFSFAIHVLLFNIIESSVVTIFVCLAEEPDLLALVDADLYRALHAAYDAV